MHALLLGKRTSMSKVPALWKCRACGEIYDPAIGDPENNIPPGTAFEDLPESWICPTCGARKADFEPMGHQAKSIAVGEKML